MQVYLILGISTERTLGTTVSSKTVKNEEMNLANQNRRVIDRAIMNAIENKYLIVAMNDDYTTINSNHRPTDNKAITCRAMCTIVCRIFPTVPAILITSLESLRCPSVINVHSVVPDMTSSSWLQECMQEWLEEVFSTQSLSDIDLTSTHITILRMSEKCDTCMSMRVCLLHQFKQSHLRWAPACVSKCSRRFDDKLS